MTVAALRVIKAMPFMTLQDRERQGWKRFGVSGAGAMDLFGLAAANVLVGNAPYSAAIEFAYGAGAWAVEAESCRIAIAGGSFMIQVDGRPVPSWTTMTLHRGQVFQVDGAPDAVWGYLAVAFGFAVPLRFGSSSTHVRSGLGGFNGRPLRDDDQLSLNATHAPDVGEHMLEPIPTSKQVIAHAVLGPQDDLFTPEAIHKLFTEPFFVTFNCDRLGYRLSGPSLAHINGPDIVSDGVVPGSIQVPGDQQPIVLMRDCQTPGGYAKIATVITPDLARIAQTRPGRQIQFRQVAVSEAQFLRRSFFQQIAVLPHCIKPLAYAESRLR